MTTQRYRLGFGLLPLLLVVAAGCGEKKPSVIVKGVVTVDDKPLPSGVVFIQNEAGTQRASGSIGPNGEFTVGGAPLGEVKVSITHRPLPMGMGDPTPGMPKPILPPKREDGPKDPNEPTAEEIERIKASVSLLATVSPDYQNPAKTPVKETLKAGENTIKVELKSGKAPGR